MWLNWIHFNIVPTVSLIRLSTITLASTVTSSLTSPQHLCHDIILIKCHI